MRAALVVIAIATLIAVLVSVFLHLRQQSTAEQGEACTTTAFVVQNGSSS